MFSACLRKPMSISSKSGRSEMGALRRRIEIAARPDRGAGGEARAVVEDDFHHFRVTVRHGGGRVTGVSSWSLRHPTAICPLAGGRLAELVGMGLAESSVAVMEQTDARQQCTHRIDLAGLAVAAAARGIARRTYEAEIPDRLDGRCGPSLRRDGMPILTWEMAAGMIVGPEPYAGRGIGSGFTGWARETLSLDNAEAALVLRRAVFISGGRGIDLDAPGRRTGPVGGCWTWQPEQAARAVRMVGSTQDFTDRADDLTRDDRGWLAFEA
jgi:hypothetical protein